MKTITISDEEYERIKNDLDKIWTKHEVPAKTLEWGAVAPKKMTWEEANEWCEEQGGRLPTSLELLQAYHDKIGGFDPASYFWSATTYPYSGYQNYAMIVYFSDGYVFYGNKTNSYYVRCVRG